MAHPAFSKVPFQADIKKPEEGKERYHSLPGMIARTPLLSRPKSEGGGFNTGMRDYVSQNVTPERGIQAGVMGGALVRAAKKIPAIMKGMIGLGTAEGTYNLGKGIMSGKKGLENLDKTEFNKHYNFPGPLGTMQALGNMESPHFRKAGRHIAGAIGNAMDFSRAPAATPIGDHHDPSWVDDLNIDNMALPDEEAMAKLMEEMERERLKPLAGAKRATDDIINRTQDIKPSYRAMYERAVRMQP